MFLLAFSDSCLLRGYSRGYSRAYFRAYSRGSSFSPKYCKSVRFARSPVEKVNVVYTRTRCVRQRVSVLSVLILFVDFSDSQEFAPSNLFFLRRQFFCFFSLRASAGDLFWHCSSGISSLNRGLFGYLKDANNVAFVVARGSSTKKCRLVVLKMSRNRVPNRSVYGTRCPARCEQRESLILRI